MNWKKFDNVEDVLLWVMLVLFIVLCLLHIMFEARTMMGTMP